MCTPLKTCWLLLMATVQQAALRLQHVLPMGSRCQPGTMRVALGHMYQVISASDAATEISCKMAFAVRPPLAAQAKDIKLGATLPCRLT